METQSGETPTVYDLLQGALFELCSDGYMDMQIRLDGVSNGSQMRWVQWSRRNGRDSIERILFS